MANEFSPLIAVMRELTALVAKKASGLLFIVTEDNHSCIVRLHGGQIEDVTFRMSRGDEAVQRLSMVGAARARFQANPGSRAGNGSILGEDSLEWLLGGFEQTLSAQPSAPAPRVPVPAQGDASGTDGITAEQQAAISGIALQYFGPIASMLCDEAFETAAPLQATLEQLAGNLSSPDETQRFLRDVRAALARLPQ